MRAGAAAQPAAACQPGPEVRAALQLDRCCTRECCPATPPVCCSTHACICLTLLRCTSSTPAASASAAPTQAEWQAVRPAPLSRQHTAGPGHLLPPQPAAAAGRRTRAGLQHAHEHHPAWLRRPANTSACVCVSGRASVHASCPSKQAACRAACTRELQLSPTPPRLLDLCRTRLSCLR